MSRKDLQRKIDEEVSIYQQRNTRPDSYADVSVFPPDLLVEIFLLVQNKSPLKNWHQITHVFRHWRHAALSTAILWTAPPTRRHNYTNLMLERSKSANLNIIINLQVSTATIISISSHIGRIQTLKMTLTTGALADACDRFIASSHMLSQLESLDIERPTWRGERGHWTFPSMLIRQSTSSMRSLRLSQVVFDWQMLARLDLAALHLTHIGLTERISGKMLQDTLRTMPRLQYLAFNLDTLLLPHDAPFRQASKLAFAHLRSMDLADSNSQHMPYFLSHLALPKLNSLKINSTPVPRGESYPSHTLATIATILASGDFQVSGSLLVEPNHIVISSLNGVFVAIRLPCAETEDQAVLLTQQLLRQLPPVFSGLVQVTFIIPLNSNELVQIFGNMHQLKAVHHLRVRNPDLCTYWCPCT